MSLRFFHIVFITLAAVLAAVVGVWALRGPSVPVYGVLCLAAALVLAAYGVWYVRKTRGQSLI